MGRNFWRLSYGGGRKCRGVKHESGLVDGTFAGGAATPWSACRGTPSALGEIVLAAIILICNECETDIELIMDRRIITGSGRSIKSLTPINKLELIIIKSC